MSTWKQIKDNPESFNKIKSRADILRATREFFWLDNFLETDTLISSPTVGQEPYLNPVKIVLSDPSGSEHNHYLQTSPELSMKKLLAGGFEKIFQISHCFRNRESFGGLHYPEFLLLEWYRLKADYFKIMDDTEKLIKDLARKFKKNEVIFSGKKSFLLGDWDRLTMREVWQKYLGLELDNYLDLKFLSGLAEKYKVKVVETDRYEDVFYKIFLNEIEPKLGVGVPTIIYEYPAELSSLARLCPENKKYAERFELYICGVELANGFGELLDPVEQRARFMQEQKIRAELNKEELPMDDDFLSALKNLSDEGCVASGVALGLERLTMLLAGSNDIKDILLLPPEDKMC